MAERKYVQREIVKDPTKWLESNKLDPFRIGKDMTERKMPVLSLAEIGCLAVSRIANLVKKSIIILT